MIILKIKDKGIFIEIPGLKSFRSPGEIEIPKDKINIATTYLLNHGIQNFEISSLSDALTQTNVNVVKKRTEFDNSFLKLEKITNILCEKDKDVDYSNLEQNTTKTKNIKTKEVIEKIKNPKIEELDISKIITKSKNTKIPSTKNNTTDFDNSSDLLSRMMDQEDV